MDVPGLSPPQQKRSRDTLRRFLDATEELLEEQRFEETSVTEIVQRADSSVGSFYQRFDDKDALLHALDRRLARQSRKVLETVAEVDWSRDWSLAETLTLLLRPWVESYHERRGLRRALLEASRRNPAFRSRAAETERKAAAVLAELLEKHEAEIEPPDPRRAARHLVVALVGYLREAVLYRELQSVAVPANREEVVEETTRLVLGYLGLPVPESGGGEHARDEFPAGGQSR